MPRPDGRIDSGEPLYGAITARAWNRMMDSADVVLGKEDSESVTMRSQSVGYTRMLGQNTTGGVIPQWGAGRITGIAIQAGAGANVAQNAQFAKSPVATIGTPTGQPDDRIAIAIEPIRPGTVGWFAVSGIIQARIEVVSASDGYAAGKASTAELKSGSTGPLEILWKEGVGGGKLALMRFAAASSPASLKLCRTSAQWPKGTTASLAVFRSDGGATGETIAVLNLFGDIASGKWVWAAQADDGVYVYVNSEMDPVNIIWKITEGPDKLLFKRKEIWVHTPKDIEDDFIATTDCVEPYTPKAGE